MGSNKMKSDFLRECMSDPALVERPMPIDHFAQAFCIVCSQKECTRSRSNTMLFTERVSTWKSRLFDNVPRADDNDTNYGRIRAKNFQSVEDPIIINTESVRIPEQIPVLKPEEDKFPTVTKNENQSTNICIEPSVLVVQNKEPELNNTPFQGGIIISGKPIDKTEDKIMEPGSTFTFEE